MTRTEKNISFRMCWIILGNKVVCLINIESIGTKRVQYLKLLRKVIFQNYFKIHLVVTVI